MNRIIYFQHAASRARTLLAIALLCMGVLQVQAQSDLMQAAQTSISRHQWDAAEASYTQILENNPQHIDARLGRAAVRAWQKKYILAEQDYQQALAQAPDRQDARTGLGFTLGWAGKLTDARREFQRVLEADPENLEARKGMAYAALWRGFYDEAGRRFKALATAYPEQTEFHLALARAYLNAGRHREARQSMARAQGQQPNHQELAELQHAVQAQFAHLEFQGWGGYTQLGSVARAGLRGLELGWRPFQDLRLSARYDNSLSFDNLSVVQGNRNIRAYYLGATKTWNSRLISQGEIGRRTLSGGQGQTLVKAEQVVVFPGGNNLKVGGFTSLGNTLTNEWMAYVGYSLPVNERFRFEPHYYYAGIFGGRQHEHRLLLSSNYQMPNGHQVSAGLMYGQAKIPENSFSRDLYGANLLWNAPLGSRHWFQVLLRFESGAQENFVLAAAGLKVRLEK